MPTVMPSRDAVRAAAVFGRAFASRRPRAPTIASINPVSSAQEMRITKNIASVRNCATPAARPAMTESEPAATDGQRVSTV